MITSIGKSILVYLSIAVLLAGCGGGVTTPGASTATPSFSKAITAYALAGAAGTVNETNKTIAVTVPSGTSVTALIATFTTTGVSVTVGATAQVSGTTPNNFTNPVVYTVTAADGSTANYTVTVTVAAGSTTRAINANTTFVKNITTTFQATTEVCPQVSRDTSSCQSARTSLGLGGNWLKFSCNVVEGLATASLAPTTSYSSATYVTLTTTSMPDYTSNYWPQTGSYSFTAYGYTVAGTYAALYSAFTTPFPDPGLIGQQSIVMYIPLNPAQATPQSQIMGMGSIGMAIDGAVIFDSMAANTDNIFSEAGSFDECAGHPAGTKYHHHSEPYSISYDDNNVIGVLRDGFFVYGRRNFDGTTPGSTANIQAAGQGSDIYVYGGDVGPDPATGTGSSFHYHLTEWQGCYHESGGVKSADDGETNDTFNTPAGSCGGTWVDAWLLSGHGNGGVFATIPSGLSGQTPSQSTPALRYYYGTPGTCTGC